MCPALNATRCQNSAWGSSCTSVPKACSGDNQMTAPLYLRKAGLAAKAMGDDALSTAYYQRILDTYPATPEAREAEKLIGANN